MYSYTCVENVYIIYSIDGSRLNKTIHIFCLGCDHARQLELVTFSVLSARLRDLLTSRYKLIMNIIIWLRWEKFMSRESLIYLCIRNFTNGKIFFCAYEIYTLKVKFGRRYQACDAFTFWCRYMSSVLSMRFQLTRFAFSRKAWLGSWLLS